MYGSRATFMVCLPRCRGSAVERGPVAEVDLDPVPAVEGRHAGVADHLGGIAVPGAGPNSTLAGRDRVDPLLELDVVGGDEALPPVLGHPDARLVRSAHHHQAAVRQRGGPGLADHLAADV